MKSLRTPDDRFEDLSDYPFAPNFVEISDQDGFGKSDKPTEKGDYTYERHVAWGQEAIPVTAGGDKPFRELASGAQGQPHVTVAGANHFFQDDAPEELCQVIIDAIGTADRAR